MTLQYGLVVEDQYLMRAGEILVKRIATKCGAEVEVLTRRMNGKGDFRARFYEPVRELWFRHPGLHKILAVCDADRDDPERLEAELRARAAIRVPGLPFALVFHVIRVELETWLVADDEAVSRATGARVPFPGGNIEASMPDPKGYLESRLPTRVPYTPTIAAAIAETLNLDVLSQRCNGFSVFQERVKNGRHGKT